MLARVDEFDRFVSVLVFIPKDRYDTTIRLRVGEYLAADLPGPRLGGLSDLSGRSARAHALHHRPRRRRDAGDRPATSLESGHRATSSGPGATRCASALAGTIGGPARPRARGALRRRLLRRLSRGLRRRRPRSPTSRSSNGHGAAAARRRSLPPRRRPGDSRVNLKVFSRGAALPLSDRVPLLENLGFRVVNERTYRIAPAGGDEADRVWLHDMTLERAAGRLDRHRGDPGPIEAALLALSARACRNPTASTASSWKPASAGATSRWCAPSARYLRQIRIPYGAGLPRRDAGPPSRASPAQIVRLFHARFDPRADADAPRLTREAAIRGRDRRRRSRTSRASTTTASCAASSTSSKRPSAPTSSRSAANGMPRRRSPSSSTARRSRRCRCRGRSTRSSSIRPRVEGVHLRFGKVARGGLRWSDRPQDFRTEVLGLVKAQQVKNAVIVPVGAKGGFVPKHLPPAGDRAAWLAEGTESYRIFVRTPAASSPTTSSASASCRRPTPCATTPTIPISSSPPTRAPRPSPTSPTPSRSSRASGSATPSPPAAARATTTRRWASPRAAPGRR